MAIFVVDRFKAVEIKQEQAETLPTVRRFANTAQVLHKKSAIGDPCQLILICQALDFSAQPFDCRNEKSKVPDDRCEQEDQ
ncbi:hypothetical protein D3C71_1926560 [compost metagenome]